MMKRVFKKLLPNLLVLMMVLLPLRVMAAPVGMSSSHCMRVDLAAEMSADMPAVNSAELKAIAIGDMQPQNCDYCPQCVGHCATSTNATTLPFTLPEFSETKVHKTHLATASLLLSRATSPPSRPPRILH